VLKEINEIRENKKHFSVDRNEEEKIKEPEDLMM
jgi:hypothetical protein